MIVISDTTPLITLMKVFASCGALETKYSIRDG